MLPDGRRVEPGQRFRINTVAGEARVVVIAVESRNRAANFDERWESLGSRVHVLVEYGPDMSPSARLFEDDLLNSPNVEPVNGRVER